MFNSPQYEQLISNIDAYFLDAENRKRFLLNIGEEECKDHLERVKSLFQQSRVQNYRGHELLFTDIYLTMLQSLEESES